MAITNGLLCASGAACVYGHNALVEQRKAVYNWDKAAYTHDKLIDVRAFCSGEYNKNVKQNDFTSNLWMMDKPKDNLPMLSQFVWGAYAENVKTKFTTIQRIPSDMEIKMVEDFKKFVDMRYEN